MTEVVLDTSVVIALTQEGPRGGPVGVRAGHCRVADLRRTPTWGGTRAHSDDRAPAGSCPRSDADVFGPGLPFDDRSARYYGLIASAIADRNGDPKAHRTDRMIAAVAGAHEMSLLTLNAGDMRGIDTITAVIALS